MARRRDTDLVSFDVSYDAGLEDGFDASGGAGDGPGVPERGPSWRDRWRAASPRRRRRIVGSAGAALVVAVGGVGVAGAVQAHVDAERLRESPGGVVSLDGDLTEAWSVDAGVAAVLAGGGLVGIDGTEAVARAVADGAELWRVELGEAPECGPSPRLTSSVEWTLTADVVTCLHGPDGERTVTVLDADGAVVGQRDLDPERYGADVEVVPAADGALAVAALEAPAWVGREFDSQFAAQSAIDATRGLLDEASAHVEDAVTGELRAEMPLHDAPASWTSCAFVVSAALTGESERFRVAVDGSPRPVTTPALTGHSMCGNGGFLTAAGAWVDLPAWTSSDFGVLGGLDSARPFPGGGIVVPRGDQGTVLVADDGTERLEGFTRHLLVPMAQVGEVDPEAVALGSGTAGLGAILGVAGDEVRWETEPVDGAQVLARTAGTTVVVQQTFHDDGDVEVSLVGLDDADGTERWRTDVSGTEGGVAYPTSAVTDGDRVTLAVVERGGDGGATFSVRTVDLGSGAETSHPLDVDGVPHVTAVNGHLLLLVTDEADGYWGDDPAVETVRVLEPR